MLIMYELCPVAIVLTICNYSHTIIPCSGYNLWGTIFANYQTSRLAAIFAIIKFTSHRICHTSHLALALTIIIVELLIRSRFGSGGFHIYKENLIGEMLVLLP